MFSLIFYLISTNGVGLDGKEAVMDPGSSELGGALPALSNSWNLGIVLMPFTHTRTLAMFL